MEEEVIIYREVERDVGDSAAKPKPAARQMTQGQEPRSEIEEIMQEFEQAAERQQLSQKERQDIQATQTREVVNGQASQEMSYEMHSAVEQRLRALGVFDVIQTQESELEKKADELEAEPVKRGQPNKDSDSDRVNYVVCTNEQSCAIGGQRIALKKGAKYCSACGSETKILKPAPDEVVVVREEVLSKGSSANKALAQAKKNGVKFVEDPRRAIFRVAAEQGYFVGGDSYIAKSPKDLSLENCLLIFKQEGKGEFVEVARLNIDSSDARCTLNRIFIHYKDFFDDMMRIANRIGEETRRTIEAFFEEEPPFSIFPADKNSESKPLPSKLTYEEFFQLSLRELALQDIEICSSSEPHSIDFLRVSSCEEVIEKGFFGRRNRFIRTSYFLEGCLDYLPYDYNRSNWGLQVNRAESREILLPPVLELARKHGITLSVAEYDLQKKIVKTRKERIRK